MDIETIEWLENFLTTGNKTIILITHDRYFLENVCTEIKELDNQTIYSYKGNYSHFLLKKAEREAQEEQENSKNLAFLRKELEWMQRQPKARGTKSKSRIDNFYDVKSKVKTKDSNTKLELNVEIQRQGNKILELSNIQKFYNGKPVIKDFSYIFKKGDRIGLAGKNGTGKSTFLNLITQQEKLDGGEINIGETTVFGYYTQSGIPLKEGERVIDSIKNIAEFIKLAGGKSLLLPNYLLSFCSLQKNNIP